MSYIRTKIKYRQTQAKSETFLQNQVNKSQEIAIQHFWTATKEFFILFCRFHLRYREIKSKQIFID